MTTGKDTARAEIARLEAQKQTTDSPDLLTEFNARIAELTEIVNRA